MLGGRDMGESLSLVLQVDWNAGRRYQVSEKVVKGLVARVEVKVYKKATHGMYVPRY
jgi:hypothetical protein